MALPPARRMTFVALTAGVVVGDRRARLVGAAAAVQGALQRPRRLRCRRGHRVPQGREDPVSGRRDRRQHRGRGGTLYETRMALAGRGIPQGGGVGFEIFDKQTLGMTDFVQRLNYQRALAGRAGALDRRARHRRGGARPPGDARALALRRRGAPAVGVGGLEAAGGPRARARADRRRRASGGGERRRAADRAT